jgi:hypothetical protein
MMEMSNNALSAGDFARTFGRQRRLQLDDLRLQIRQLCLATLSQKSTRLMRVVRRVRAAE